MGCYHPLKGFPYGETNSGRTNFIVTSYSVDHIEIDKQGNIRKPTSRGISSNTRLCIPGSEAIEIPCGQCIGCRLDQSALWASRCMVEMQQHDYNCFLTLTYDEEHIPESWFCRMSDHTENVWHTLRKKDLQLFWKSLRNYLNKREDGSYAKKGDYEFRDFRYYAAGEYGDQSARSHYHAIMFGFDPRNDAKFNDIELYSSSDLGYNYYVSEKLNQIWKRGQVIIADASWESAAYTARYVMKKQKGMNRSFYEDNCIEPEFVVMSRNPGIGFDFYNSHKESYATFLYQYLSSNNGRREIGKIRYFDNKLDEEYPFDYEKLKSTRKRFADFKKKLKLQQTSLSYIELLEREEAEKKNKTRIFKRVVV